MVVSTKRLIYKRLLHKSLGDEAPGWASEQLSAGKDGNSLCILAGLTGSINEFEIVEIFDSSLTELGVSIPDKKEAILAYALETADEYLKKRVSKVELLELLCQICIELDYFEPLYQFYLLKFSWEDLMESNWSPHLATATRENFDTLLVEEIGNLKKYLEVKNDNEIS